MLEAGLVQCMHAHTNTHTHTHTDFDNTVSGSAPAVLNKANSPQLWTVNRAEQYL